jgi:hypothetical protein
MQEGLDKKWNNTNSFLQGVASKYENLTWGNTKWYQQRIEGEDKQITSNKHKWYEWFVLSRFGSPRT